MSVEQLRGEPIIVATFDNHADQLNVMDGYLQSFDLANEITGPVYRIIDIRQATTSYVRIITTIQNLMQAVAGASIVPELAMAFVGQPHMAQSGIAFFDNMNDALTYARAQVAEGVTSV